jgi:ribosome-associated protein
MPCRRGRNRASVQVFPDRLSHQCGSVAASDGSVEFLAEFVVERDGNADGHVIDTINGTTENGITDPIGVSWGRDWTAMSLDLWMHWRCHHGDSSIPAVSAHPTVGHDAFVREVSIATDSIRLGQFLKLADAVDVGSDVKALLASGAVLVNGEPETRRGRQVFRGDVVTVEDVDLRVG